MNKRGMMSHLAISNRRKPLSGLKERWEETETSEKYKSEMRISQQKLKCTELQILLEILYWNTESIRKKFPDLFSPILPNFLIVSTTHAPWI
jgi:hypothetical protein